MSRRGWAAVVVAALLSGAVLLGSWTRRAGRIDLPYRDQFAQRRTAEWTPSGGSWRLDGDAIAVSTDGSGAKLTGGSARWRDYQMWAEVKLLGRNGTVGVAVRAGNEGTGTEAIRGYLVTLRSSDAGLEITRASQAVLSVAPSRLPGGIHANTWYRMHVIVVGCSIAAEAINVQTGMAAYAGFEDREALCLRSGGVALRTTATAAAWRQVRISPARAGDLAEMGKHLADSPVPAYPIRERDYSAMRERYLATVPADEINRPTNPGSFGPVGEMERSEAIGIDDLRAQVWNPSLVRIVGVITATAPLYLQDPTGGIRLGVAPGVAFQPGDEVEVLGRPTLDGASPQFEPVAGRFLSDRVTVSPLSVTATQAASGRYEGSLIEVNGTVRSSGTLPDGQLELLLDDGGAQQFSVHVPYDLFHASSRQFESGSKVRVRGVCTMDHSQNVHRGTFVLVATSGSDVMLLEGPPWWTGQRLIWLVTGCFLLIGGGIALYEVEERTKLRIVQEERERLSHDMHDTLAQSLAGVGFRLQGIHRSLQASGVVPQIHVDDLKMTCELVAQTHREASSNIAALHPSSQGDGDVLMLLERAVYSMLDDDEFPVIVSHHGVPRPLSPVVKDMLYRVGREAIANALRHAQAKSIRVQMTYRSRDVVLTVMDDGIGFVFDPLRPGFGTKTMMKRCAAVKAKFTITPAQDGGCRVQVVSPYRAHRGLARWVG